MTIETVMFMSIVMFLLGFLSSSLIHAKQMQMGIAFLVIGIGVILYLLWLMGHGVKIS